MATRVRASPMRLGSGCPGVQTCPRVFHTPVTLHTPDGQSILAGGSSGATCLPPSFLQCLLRFHFPAFQQNPSPLLSLVSRPGFALSPPPCLLCYQAHGFRCHPNGTIVQRLCWAADPTAPLARPLSVPQSVDVSILGGYPGLRARDSSRSAETLAPPRSGAGLRADGQALLRPHVRGPALVLPLRMTSLGLTPDSIVVLSPPHQSFLGGGSRARAAAPPAPDALYQTC